MFNFASEETYQDGQIIIKEGSSGDWVYVILSGSVEISKIVKEKKIIIEVLQAGEFFGELSFLGGVKRTASALAVGETTLGVIDRASLDVEFNKISADFRAILVAVVERFKKMIDRVADPVSRREERVPKTLSLSFKNPQSFVNSYTDNISSGGLFIRTENPLKKDEPFLLNLQLPGLSDPMKIKAEVVWTREQTDDAKGKPPGMGVKFCEMSNKDNEILKKYLAAIKVGKEK